ncbi:TetR family transcriptional regulator [Lentzea sp. NBRC 105346]|uniref:TetR/AcrR family transcriptional regulator n=1 Tax=Lentzea sp. NBRC 105346 TaxID=3032205 RepID=UPI0024A07C06|nr:TetR/AcrR family transcriptional regulator [Lentzea sp. NBRC 105346]GLZ28040.1 TetR family transcriptional regulator [Lentzea sp. NBRC 105346]
MPKSSAWVAGGSAERGERTRERLLDAAVVLVGEVGWGAVTTRLVTQRAGVNPALVHYHFASVADLLTTATVRFARQVLAEFGVVLRAAPSAAEGVGSMLAELGRYSGTDPASLLMAEAFLAANRLPVLRESMAELVAEFRAAVSEWLRVHGHGDDSDALAMLLAASLDGLLLHSALDPALDLGAAAAPLRRLLAEQGRAR